MSRRLPIKVARTAADQIAEASAWWKVNRTKAPNAFRDEIERVLELISTQPQIGARASNTKLVGVRRIHLSRIHYHMYYQLRESPAAVVVLALWHTSRGSEPGL